MADSLADLVDGFPVLLQRLLPFQRREVAREIALRQAGDVEQEQEVRLVARRERDEDRETRGLVDETVQRVQVFKWCRHVGYPVSCAAPCASRARAGDGRGRRRI